MTLRIPIGWQRVVVHRGVIMTGSFSIRSLTISNEAEPEPTMIEALRVVRGILLVLSISATRFLDARCADSFFVSGGMIPDK